MFSTIFNYIIVIVVVVVVYLVHHLLVYVEITVLAAVALRTYTPDNILTLVAVRHLIDR